MPKRNRPSSYAYSHSSKRYASVPAHMRKYVQKAIRSSQEKKAFFTEAGPVSLDPTTVAALHNCNKMAQGVASTQRLGDKIKAARIKVKLMLTNNATSGATPTWVRVVLLKTSNGFLNAITDGLLMDTSGNGTALTADDAADIIGPWNTDACTLLYDRVVALTPIGSDGPGECCSYVHIDQKLSDTLDFSSDSSDAFKNNIRLFIISRGPDNTPATASPIVYNVQTTFEFYDA